MCNIVAYTFCGRQDCSQIRNDADLGELGLETLTPESRAAALDQMSNGTSLDVLVVGGGITGAGIALEAASRGLKTGIVEAQDWASGTSSRSSKLIHGGLRYLEMLDFSLVREALKERELLLTTIAPNLVKQVPFLYPLKRRIVDRLVVGMGIALYDALASLGRGKRATPFHKHYSQAKLQHAFPGIEIDASVGAIEYWDAKVDDARLVFTLIRTAVQQGALAASRARVTKLVKDANGTVSGAEVLDLETDDTKYIQARTVIAASGVWTEKTEALVESDQKLKVLASKGVHITVPRERIDGNKGIILKLKKSVLFIIPWNSHWLIGTTDTPYSHDLQHPVGTSTDIDYILEQANSILKSKLTTSDVLGVFAGLRPLLQPAKSAPSTKISREHTVAAPAPGFVVIAGGKLTTYRPMAEDAIDFMLGKDNNQKYPSVTKNLPLAGALNYKEIKEDLDEELQQLGISSFHRDSLLERYGTNVTEVLELMRDDESLQHQLEHAPDYLRAEIVYAAQSEMVLHLDDVMSRRTRISNVTKDKGLDAVEEIIDLISPILGWTKHRCNEERAEYMKLSQFEMNCEEVHSDRDTVSLLQGFTSSRKDRWAVL